MANNETCMVIWDLLESPSPSFITHAHTSNGIIYSLIIMYVPFIDHSLFRSVTAVTSNFLILQIPPSLSFISTIYHTYNISSNRSQVACNFLLFFGHSLGSYLRVQVIRGRVLFIRARRHPLNEVGLWRYLEHVPHWRVPRSGHRPHICNG